MRKVLLLVLIVFLFTLSACEEDPVKERVNYIPEAQKVFPNYGKPLGKAIVDNYVGVYIEDGKYIYSLHNEITPEELKEVEEAGFNYVLVPNTLEELLIVKETVINNPGLYHVVTVHIGAISNVVQVGILTGSEIHKDLIKLELKGYIQIEYTDYPVATYYASTSNSNK